MKKLLLAILFLSTIAINAQEKISTTVEEYKYLTEGYKIQQETGADFKSGYELQKIEEKKISGYSYTYSLLMHKESKKAKALSIVLTKDKDKKDKVIYLCLPFNNADLLVKFFDETEKLGVTMKMYFDATMYDMLQKSLEKLANR